MNLLALDSVDFAYRPGRPILRAVTAPLSAGKLTAIVGPNGAGKSTLIKVLLGVLAPTSGRARITLATGEADVSSVPPRRRAASLAYVAQQSTAGEAFTVEQIVRLGRLSRPVNAPAIAAALERMSLSDVRGELFATLSAGQQQRVSLARALAQLAGADVDAARQGILADEPCSAMDPKHLVRAMGVLREEARAGRTVVVVLHDITTAIRFADDALVLDSQGRLAASGPAASVLTPATLAPVYGIEFDRLGSDADGPDGGGVGGGGVAIVPRCG